MKNHFAFRSALLFACFCLCAVAASARPFNSRVISPTNTHARQPVISDTGTVAWMEVVDDVDIMNASRFQIIWWKDGTRHNASTELGISGCKRPFIFGDEVTFVSNLGKSGGGECMVIPERPALTEHQRKLVREVPTLFHDTMHPHVPASVKPVEVPDAESNEDADPKDTGGRAESWDGTDIVIFSPQIGGRALTASDHRVSVPVLSDKMVAWQSARIWPYGYEVIVWDRINKKVHQLSTNFFYSTSPVIHGDHLVFQSWDGFDYELYLFNLETKEVTQITDNQFDDTMPAIWGGEITWVAYPIGLPEIFHWKDGDFRKLSADSKENGAPSIWEGKVVWHGMDGDDLEIYLYDGARTIKLTSNTWDDLDPKIRDNIVVWTSYVDGWDAEIMAMDLEDNLAMQLTDNDVDDVNPDTAGGKVVWECNEFGRSCVILAE